MKAVGRGCSSVYLPFAVKMELSAPFLTTYWPYIASILAGFVIAQLIRRVFQPQAPGYTVDVDPLQDTDIAAIPPADPLGFRTSGEGDAVHIPYPWFDDRLSEEEMKQKSAEFYEKMNKRRTVRKISDEDIPLEVVQNLIKTAGKLLSQRALYVITYPRSPSTKNRDEDGDDPLP